MAIKRVPIGVFVEYLVWCLANKCGYIMGAYGQDPRKWAKDSWWFTQYTGAQRTKALYWRANAPLVHDCNGLAEGGYQKETGVNINARARNNYATWCDPKGSGRIPAKYRVPGAAVFIHNGSYISHVGFLWKPVTAGNPAGDWWVIEARGVMYGCVKTKLSARGWNRWGLMTKYFDYTADADELPTPEYGQRTLAYGNTGADVVQLQLALITLGYSCGKWGADGEFGSATRNAVKAFQKDARLEVDGVAGPKTFAALNDRLPESGDDPHEAPAEMPEAQWVEIVGGNAWVRTQPGEHGLKLGVAMRGDKLKYRGEISANGWAAVDLDGEAGWVSGMYSKVVMGL